MSKCIVLQRNTTRKVYKRNVTLSEFVAFKNSSEAKKLRSEGWLVMYRELWW